PAPHDRRSAELFRRPVATCHGPPDRIRQTHSGRRAGSRTDPSQTSGGQAPMTPLFNHLWQSTLFAAAMAVLSLAFRNNHARTRYALWLAASLKFLVPFSLLVSIGDLAQLRNAPVPRQTAEYFTKAVESVSQPFATPVVAHQSAAPSLLNYIPALLLAI